MYSKCLENVQINIVMIVSTPDGILEQFIVETKGDFDLRLWENYKLVTFRGIFPNEQ